MSVYDFFISSLDTERAIGVFLSLKSVEELDEFVNQYKKYFKKRSEEG